MAKKCAVVVALDAGLFVVLCDCRSVLLSMSGAGRGRGLTVTLGEDLITVVVGMKKIVGRTREPVVAGVVITGV